MKNIVVEYSKNARKFLASNEQLLSVADANTLLAKAARKLLLYEENNTDVIALQGKLKGLYRVRKGDIRMIFSLHNGIAVVVAVETIDFRGIVY